MNPTICALCAVASKFSYTNSHIIASVRRKSVDNKQTAIVLSDKYRFSLSVGSAHLSDRPHVLQKQSLFRCMTNSTQKFVIDRVFEEPNLIPCEGCIMCTVQ